MTATEAPEDLRLNEKTILADPPSDEYKSIWTALRGVEFSQGWLDVKGVKIRYIRSGNPKAPKLIMLPGTGGHAETYAANLGPLGQAFDCWAIDVPGCGYSDKPEGSYDSNHHAAFVKDMAETIGAQKVNLLGCSVGSWTALRVAVDYPALVDKVILGSPSGGPIPEKGDPWYESWNTPRVGDAGRVRREITREPTWEAARKILHGLSPDPRRLCDDLIAARLDVNRQPGAADVVEKVYWWSDPKQRHDNAFSRETLRAVQTPILGVCEVHDRQLPLIRAMFSCLPNSRLVRIDGIGHWPHYEAARQFNELAMEFLAG